MSVTLLPAAPAPTDSALTFPGIANTFFAALRTMVSEANTLTGAYPTPPTPLSTLPALPGTAGFVFGADTFVASLPGLVSDVNGIITELSLSVTAVTTLPATPSRTSDPGNFATKGPAFLIALTTLRTELNAFIAALNGFVAGNLQLSGDMQSGSDLILLSGDMQSGTDNLLLSGSF